MYVAVPFTMSVCCCPLKSWSVCEWLHAPTTHLHAPTTHLHAPSTHLHVSTTHLHSSSTLYERVDPCCVVTLLPFVVVVEFRSCLAVGITKKGPEQHTMITCDACLVRYFRSVILTILIICCRSPRCISCPMDWVGDSRSCEEELLEHRCGMSACLPANLRAQASVLPACCPL